MASKYDPLVDFLNAGIADRQTLTFDQIEVILRTPLPESATGVALRDTWWRNDETHSHARVWMKAGWRTAPLERGVKAITFIRKTS